MTYCRCQDQDVESLLRLPVLFILLKCRGDPRGRPGSHLPIPFIFCYLSNQSHKGLFKSGLDTSQCEDAPTYFAECCHSRRNQFLAAERQTQFDTPFARLRLCIDYTFGSAQALDKGWHPLGQFKLETHVFLQISFQLIGRTLCDNLAMIDDRYPVTEFVCLEHVVRGQQDGAPRVLSYPCTHIVAHHSRRLDIQSYRRFIQKEYFRV